jgi:hypothetical protein
MTADEGAEFFYQQLPEALGDEEGNQDLICKLIELHCKQSLQKIGNCWWTNPKSGFLGILLVQNLLRTEARHYKNHEEKAKALIEVIEATQKIYKYFSEFARIQILKEYLTRPVDGAERDHALVKRVIDKLNSKRWKYVIDEKGYLEDIYGFLVNLIKDVRPEKKDSESIPPLYKRSEINRWIEDYKSEFDLTDNLTPRDPLMFIGR